MYRSCGHFCPLKIRSSYSLTLNKPPRDLVFFAYLELSCCTYNMEEIRSGTPTENSESLEELKPWCPTPPENIVTASLADASRCSLLAVLFCFDMVGQIWGRIELWNHFPAKCLSYPFICKTGCRYLISLVCSESWRTQLQKAGCNREHHDQMCTPVCPTSRRFSLLHNLFVGALLSWGAEEKRAQKTQRGKSTATKLFSYSNSFGSQGHIPHCACDAGVPNRALYPSWTWPIVLSLELTTIAKKSAVSCLLQELEDLCMETYSPQIKLT